MKRYAVFEQELADRLVFREVHPKDPSAFVVLLKLAGCEPWHLTATPPPTNGRDVVVRPKRPSARR